jgi:hypothetical protein
MLTHAMKQHEWGTQGIGLFKGMGHPPFQIAAGVGLVCGTSAVIALVCGSVLMIRETQLAVKGIELLGKI